MAFQLINIVIPMSQINQHNFLYRQAFKFPFKKSEIKSWVQQSKAQACAEFLEHDEKHLLLCGMLSLPSSPPAERSQALQLSSLSCFSSAGDGQSVTAQGGRLEEAVSTIP